MAVPFSIVIPAHNESAVIERCLRSILADAGPGERPEVIVVCNACVDDTAERARGVADHIVVLDIATASKAAAINAGNHAATSFPRFVIDADVVVDYRSLSAVAAVLAAGTTMVAAPAIRVATARCSRLVRSYYDTWLTQPYVNDAMVGSGIYGLSAAGLARVGAIPPIIADDAFVRSRFAPGERRNIGVDGEGEPIGFTVFPPRTVRDLVRIESRRRAGDAEQRALYPSVHAGRTTTSRTLQSAKVSPHAKAIYLAIKAAGRLHFAYSRWRGRAGVWLRDESSRQGIYDGDAASRRIRNSGSNGSSSQPVASSASFANGS